MKQWLSIRPPSTLTRARVHGGTLPGYQIGYERFTRPGLAVAIMANVYPVDVDKMANDVARLFFKRCGTSAPDQRCALSGLAVGTVAETGRRD